MSKRQIILHIGFSKTGSSALQVFLSQNQELFSKYNYDYPVIDPYHVEKARQGKISSGNGQLLLEKLRTDLKDGSFTRSNNLLSPFLQLEGGETNVIISSESYGVLTAEEIEFFSKFLKQFPCSVKIICYVRRQDQYIESAWKQWQSKEADTIQLESIRDRINWRTRIDSWASFFGKDNLIVRPYEKTQLPNGVIPDFLDILGIPWKDQVQIPEVDVNHGFTQDVLDLRKINRGFYRNIHDNRLDEFLNDVLDDRFTKKMFDQYQLLSPNEKIEILKFFEEDNQYIAREFLGRKDGRLFFEPWPKSDINWKPYKGLTLNRYIPIATQIEYTLYQKNQNLENELLEVKSQVAVLQERINRLESGLKPSKLRGYTRPGGDQPKGLVTRISSFLWLQREKRIIKESGLFDEEYYLRQYPDVAKSGIDPISHYIANGWKEGRNPNVNFSTTNYLNEHPEVAAHQTNPFIHYILEIKH